jgi:plasmid stabilization system protein ParE
VSRWEIRRQAERDLDEQLIYLAKMLVFYRPTDQGIDIIRVLHGGRDFPTLLEKELF